MQDVTYFQSELRTKMSILGDEINRINAEIDSVTKENSNYAVFEKKADTLADEIKELQSQLGDLNTLVDKLHTNTDLEEAERQFNQLKSKNQREAQVLDEIFLQRQQRDASVKEVESQIANEKLKAEAQINDLDPAKRSEYARLRAENDEYVKKIAEYQDQIETFSQKSYNLQQEIAQDYVKQKAVALYMRLSEVREKKRELEDSIQKASTESGPQEKNRLLEQVRLPKKTFFNSLKITLF